ncbi:hypothetical protein RI129_008353 [Pyrocoelia pectoralis]|uniref:Uncharacterized protein n=1 Tax=Pyrocoelia pectoralis TaxID=417401 RepID=A0AAN7ZKC4_9COLE
MSEKKRRVEISRDPEVWKRWFDETSSGEESPINEEGEDELENNDVNADVAEESDHNTESELELSEEEVSGSDEGLLLDVESDRPINFYLRKDKTTKWKKHGSSRQVRIRSHNIIKFLRGTKGDEIDCLNLFVNETVIKIITVSTNIYLGT